ncbi:hypothetical protein HanXRQr2_Chr01g0042221 [Helianthus annuus]|uniref:Uncharacterized protein n=1 Tax=Helianthus annuus TaxID=4232 RepID=A0A9K3JYF7_HELAN|nr:hypothetical protein HanXRQr2_Chr01g0042221 [Helianthus annuus]KAJ0958633.1 hypothetical protein HanPSC8_Chr01g0041071 [Helianthus annuus]
MNRPFVFWKRVLNFCWIKFPCTESNIQVTVDRFVFSLLSYFTSTPALPAVNIGLSSLSWRDRISGL